MAESKQTMSFEVFPPNTEIGTEKLFVTLDALKALNPDFISVTCSNNKADIEQTTIKVADYVQNQLKIPTTAHLPAAYLDKNQVTKILTQLREHEIHNILALRGDILPEIERKTDFMYASDLVKFIHEFDENFVISGACYPEIHPESQNRVTDLSNLTRKVDAGVSNLITQLFFDNESFYNFRENCAIAGIEVPILAGVMPIINRNQALRLFKTSQTKLPRKFVKILERYENNPEALRDAGIAYAIDQIVDLLTEEAAGIHLYTMNNAKTAQAIHRATGSLFDFQKTE